MVQELNVGKENLEKKVDFWGRTKYMAGPAALTVVSYFVPEMKKKYTDLSQDKKDAYRTVALASSTILGSVLAIASGYKLAKNSSDGKNG
jgi:hypothetical protein